MTVNYKPTRYLVLIVFAMLNAACISQIASVKDSANSWIGQSIDRRNQLPPGKYEKQIKWQEKTYLLPNGNTVFVEPVREDCFIHWEVDKSRTIVAYKTEGARCW